MARLIYSAICSLDGYVENADGTDVSSARTRIDRDFDSDAVRRVKQESAADLTVGEERRFAGGVVFLRYRVSAS
jgi:hypothetical protein